MAAGQACRQGPAGKAQLSLWHRLRLPL